MGRQTSSGDRYTLISSDTHAGGSHAQYREFLDPGSARTSTPGGAGTATPSATWVTTAACATGTTRCATPSRIVTAWSAR